MTLLSEITYNCNSEPPKGYQPWGDGWDWIEWIDKQRGTATLSSWGCDGWDLGQWPYIVMSIRTTEDDGSKVWTSISYCEGDVTERTFDVKDEVIRSIDAFAETYWRLGQSSGPDDVADYPEGALPEKYRGPFSNARLRLEESNAKAG